MLSLPALCRSAFDTLYVVVTFSEAVTLTSVGSTRPTLALATGSHFESNAASGVALLLTGGSSASKGFWLNDSPGPLLSGLAQPCRGDGPRYLDLAGTRNALGTSYTSWAYGADRPWNRTRSASAVSLCVPGAAPEARTEQATATRLVFGLDVTTAHRSARLDVLSPAALSLGSWSLASTSTGRPARLTLPWPGSALSPGMSGQPGSLSATQRIVVGSPYVLSVTSDSVSGIYGVGQAVDLIVRFSEPIAVSCGSGNANWIPAASRGVILQGGASPSVTAFSSCGSVTLSLVTAGRNANSANGSAVLVADTLPQLNPATVAAPAVSAAGPWDGTDVLRFRYVVKAFDTSCPAFVCTPLQYSSSSALALAGGSLIRRASDGAAAGVALPPLSHAANSLGVHRKLLLQTPNGQV